MAKISANKRLVKEDFAAEEQDLIDKLAFIINPIIQEIVYAFNKNITITDNLNMEIRTIEVEVDSSGLPKSPTFYKSTLTTKVSGVIIIKCEKISDNIPVFSISSITAATPTVVTTSAPHGYNTGEKIVIDNSNSFPKIDGTHSITALSPTTFQIPLTTTIPGSTGNTTLYFNDTPLGAPFASIVESNKSILIKQITGIPTNTKFNITFLSIGI